MVAFKTNVKIHGDKSSQNDVIYTSEACQRIWMTCMFISTMAVIVLGTILGIRITSQMHAMQEEIANNRDHIAFLERQTTSPENTNDSMVDDVTFTRNRFRRTASDSSLIGAHVVGTRGRSIARSDISQQIPQPNNFFRWNYMDNELSTTHFRVDIADGDSGTFFEIRESGYYYVYSQVTYYGKGQQGVGHETIQLSGNRDVVLMTSVAMQVLGSAKEGRANRMRNLDSSYHGGMFYLYENDRVAVRPTNWQINGQRFHMEKTKSFFGLFCLHA